MQPDDRPARFLDMGRDDIGALLDSLRREPRLALDTESDPFHRYFEKVCLIQISTREADFFFDPLAHGMPDPLRVILEDPDRTLVIHGADYDVRAMKQSFGLTLGCIFDTGIAAQLLGLPGLGLKALLETELGVTIDKTEQRSDWGTRPLTAAQLEYARQDTRFLLALADCLRDRLEALGRLEWLEEECAILRSREPREKVFDPGSWRKLKGAKELGPVGQRALRAAHTWREDAARAADLPPFRVIRNEALVELSRQVERRGPEILGRLKDLHLVPKWIDRAALAQAIRAALAAGEPVEAAAGWNQRARAGKPLGAEAKVRLERLRAARAIWAAELGLDPGFLVSGAVLEAVAREEPRDLAKLRDIAGLTEWRLGAVGPRMLEVLCAPKGSEDDDGAGLSDEGR